jgi:3-deoxy-manno-octulosonate cytidylyltransferase (CMP-KDO synthetase)
VKTVAIIPARMAATRLPGKPLLDIAGKPMIQWVFERVSQASLVSRVVVATCDQDVLDAVRGFGGEAVMTSSEHQSGTDRIAEAVWDMDVDVVVNVQGDEPLIEPSSIDASVQPFLMDTGLQMASLMFPIDAEMAQDPSLVKVVVDRNDWSLYFSRSPIPYQRKQVTGASIWGHVGLYAYSKSFLLDFSKLPRGILEQTESLEQLRALENGVRIKMVRIRERPVGVDTSEDLERVREMFRQSRVRN